MGILKEIFSKPFVEGDLIGDIGIDAADATETKSTDKVIFDANASPERMDAMREEHAAELAELMATDPIFRAMNAAIETKSADEFIEKTNVKGVDLMADKNSFAHGTYIRGSLRGSTMPNLVEVTPADAETKSTDETTPQMDAELDAMTDDFSEETPHPSA